MDEEATTSWIRRVKFSHTVCHRIDASRLAYAPFTAIPNRVSIVKSTPGAATSENHRIAPNAVQIQKNPSRNKQMVVSPHPHTKLSDIFKEARSNQKDFCKCTIKYGGFILCRTLLICPWWKSLLMGSYMMLCTLVVLIGYRIFCSEVLSVRQKMTIPCLWEIFNKI